MIDKVFTPLDAGSEEAYLEASIRTIERTDVLVLTSQLTPIEGNAVIGWRRYGITGGGVLQILMPQAWGQLPLFIESSTE